ncbi:MAG: ADP-forming succinate--CoA ligase subunit beta [Verrucomicrobiota bacterium JB024]|nr:ADP-forming succinate--CoA ligase subunit beta [Verrucomicrobiota bacterium JB024]
MNIHEYQAKELFTQYGIPVPAGKAVQSVDEFQAAIDTVTGEKIVVKSQIHAGGRGKGTFTDGYKGGVKVLDSREAAFEAGKAMLGNTLVTHQTGPKGREVKTVYFTEASKIAKEYYLAILLDRENSQPVFIASTEGGMDIEKVAAETPEKITRVHVDPAGGLHSFHKRKIAFALGLTTKEQLKQLDKLLTGLYNLFWEKDCSLVEINPLITTVDGDIEALDAKMNFDSNALYRHPEIVAMRDLGEEDPKEVEASKAGLSYIALDGNIACLVNGAGLAMATMDIIKHFGGNPANFLDVGGGGNEQQVTEAFRIILSDANVEGILVNIFGGIMSCKTIALGIIGAAKNVELNVPLVVRLEGNEVKEGKKLLDESGLKLTSADSLADAAKKIVELIQK